MVLNPSQVTEVMVYTRRGHFAMIHFVSMIYSYYLLGQDFTLRTDHSSLWWLDSFHDKATDMLACLVTLPGTLQDIMTILYRSGKNLGNADAFSCIDTRPCPHEDCPYHGYLMDLHIKYTVEVVPLHMYIVRFVIV